MGDSDRPSLAADHEAALTAHRAGRLEEARNGYRAVLSRQPDHPDALNLLALVERARGDLPTAVALSRAAVARFEHPGFLDNLGVILAEAGDHEGAEVAFLRGLELDPDHVTLLRDLVNFYVATQRYEESGIFNHRLMLLTPDDPQGYTNMGALAHIRQAFTEAEYYYGKALALETQSEDACLNLSSLRLETNRAKDAERYARAVLEWAPASRRAQLAVGHALLSQGRWLEAWPYYEARSPLAAPGGGVGAARWEGQSVLGKAFLILGEQGLGDHIQFARYGALLKTRGAAHVAIAAPATIHRLLLCVEGIDEVVDDPSEARDCDVWSPLMSLPLHFATTPETLRDTLPGGLPYIHLTADQEGPPDAGGRLKVGLFWAGGHETLAPSVSRVDAQRSLKLEQLLALTLAPELRNRVAWTILQKDRRADWLGSLAVTADWSDPFAHQADDSPQDLLDTARIIASLDLVIGVDSALIHLAAALGRPTWMMDRRNHCWRWRPGACDSDWYPGSLRIFRQQTSGDWAPVLAEVRAALGRLT